VKLKKSSTKHIWYLFSGRGGGGGSRLSDRAFILQNRTWTDHSGFRIGRGTTRTGSEYASFTPEGQKKEKKKKKKKKKTGTGCVLSDTRHHRIDRNSRREKKVYLYQKKKETNICSR